MDYNKMFKIAQGKIQDSHPGIVDKIDECIRYGSTGGEITDCVGKILMDIKQEKGPVYYKLKNEINNYLNRW
ncbi:hypothetical protein [Christiangramia sp. SM2212]|uniref:Uncharacterized protein n=1 Tax=Christiangramia sediminicola TaxID=3073267 RepID=A0ABU1ETG6_9FLAO|nr:hypothetical protein [Christiangramia sp. SM2212]MDR5591666.1 hypothetical protein [Christiangramia sp. SM2212]